jgi:Flp pilus assembly secretin CpaC
MRGWHRRLARGVVLGLLAVTGITGPATAADSNPRLYLTVDRSKILDLNEPVSKISVTNPGIADINVLSPTSILLSGRAPGATSLLLFSATRVQHFDLIIQAPPVDRASPVSASEPFDVIVQRGDKITNQSFIKDDSQGWVELGTVKPATEVKR